MPTDTYIQLPDGSWAAISRTMDYGDVVVILLLSALLIFKVYELWLHRT